MQGPTAFRLGNRQCVIHIPGGFRIDGHKAQLGQVFTLGTECLQLSGNGFRLFQCSLAELIRQSVLGHYKGVFDAGHVRFADDAFYLRLGLAILEGVAGHAAGNEFTGLCLAACTRGQEDPAGQAVLAGLDKVPLAALHVLAHQVFQVRFDQLIQLRGEFAFLFFGQAYAYPVAGEHALHFRGRKERFAPVVQHHKPELATAATYAPFGEFLGRTDVGLQLVQLFEGVGIEHGRFSVTRGRSVRARILPDGR